MLQDLGFSTAQVFPLRMGALPAGLLQYAALGLAPDYDSWNQARRLIQGGGGGGGGGGAAAELHAAALQAVIQRCQEALGGYPTPMDAIQEELAGLRQRREGQGAPALGAAPALPPEQLRREQVLGLLLQEQQVLHRTVFLLQQQLRALRKALA